MYFPLVLPRNGPDCYRRTGETYKKTVEQPSYFVGLRLGDTCEPGMLALGTVVGRVRRRVGHLVLGGALDQGID